MFFNSICAFYNQNINKMYNNIVKAPLVFPDYFPDLAKDPLCRSRPQEADPYSLRAA